VTDHPGHASALYSVVLVGEVDDPLQLVVFEDAFRAGDAVDIVVDVDEVTYLGGAGLQTLAVLCADAAERGGTVTVVRAREQVAKAIQASGLDRLLILADVPRQG
jgi:anti-anti-sigma factor